MKSLLSRLFGGNTGRVTVQSHMVSDGDIVGNQQHIPPTRTSTRIKINGREFTLPSGRGVSIRGGRIVVDGEQVDVGACAEPGILEVRIVEGVLGHLDTDASVQCGAVQGDVQAGGSVKCDAVHGDIDAGGSVNCGNVGGDVQCGGSVVADRVKGDLRAKGSAIVGMGGR